MGAARERHTIWLGLLEWIEKPKNSSNPQKVTRHIACQVSVNTKDGEPELKADGWPSKLIMQLMPKQLIRNLGDAYLNSKSVLFHPQNCEALESLTKVMSSGFVAAVHFISVPNRNACDIKLLILLYNAEKRAYVGFIPNDQAAFDDRLRKVIQQHKSTQMLRQGQGGAQAVGPSPTLGVGTPPQLPVSNPSSQTTAQQQQGIMMSQTNTMAMRGGPIPQNIVTSSSTTGTGIAGVLGQTIPGGMQPRIRMQNPISKPSKKIKLDVTPACYEGLRCSVCSGYLSCAPIRLLPDGAALCCHCVPPNNEVPYRAVIVENLLSEATFPCRYKEFGCTANVQFNNSLNHEDGCIHRSFPCASLPHTSCLWNGSASQVPGHFAEKHSDFVQQEAIIKFCVDQDKEGVLLVNENLGSFIMRYEFNSTNSSLRYQIRLCVVGADSQDCTLQLFNDLDPDYNVNLKAKCFAYNTDFCNDSLRNVDVKSALAVLNNPNNFTVVFHVKLPTPTYTRQLSK